MPVRFANDNKLTRLHIMKILPVELWVVLEALKNYAAADSGSDLRLNVYKYRRAGPVVSEVIMSSSAQLSEKSSRFTTKRPTPSS